MLKKENPNREVILHFTPSSEDRKYSRFTNNLGTLVELDSKLQNPLFTNSIKGLVLNDSLGGCSLIIATKQVLESNQICLMRSTGLSPIEVKIVWVEEVDTNIYRIGIEYLNELDIDLMNLSYY